MPLYLTQKKVLKIQPSAVSFLNGLSSNAMDQPRNAFVNIHGRIIATFDQWVSSPQEVWLVLEASFVEAVVNHLDRFARLSRVSISVGDEKVYFDLASDAKVSSDEKVIPQKCGQLLITSHERLAEVTEEEFVRFRVAHHIPLLGTDYRDAFLLNVSESEFVSFTKGCFLGQEPVAKVHHRSHPSWKLVVKDEAACTDEEKQNMTSKVHETDPERVRGFVFTKYE